jgi:hypothetical protein
MYCVQGAPIFIFDAFFFRNQIVRALKKKMCAGIKNQVPCGLV